MNNTTNDTTYVAHMRVEHRHLNEMVLEIERRFSSTAEVVKREDTSPQDMIDRLTALRNELATHFRNEEQGGCLEEAASRRPSLGREVDAVEAEHPALLGDLDRLIARLRQSASTPPPTELRQVFFGFAEALRAHEEAEDRILEYAFGAPVE